MTRVVTRRMLRWGVIALAIHSVLLILIAPSAFMYYGDGFLLTKSQAHVAHRMLDGAIEGVVYDIANYRIPQGVYWWLAQRLPTLDEVTLVSQTVLYLAVGGALYFVMGACLAAMVSVPSMIRARRVG